MSYSVQYSPELNKKYPMKTQNRNNSRKWVAVFVICLSLLLMGRSVVSPSEIGSRFAIQKERVGTMLEQIREGTAVSDAFTTYCLGVLKDAEIY